MKTTRKTKPKQKPTQPTTMKKKTQTKTKPKQKKKKEMQNTTGVLRNFPSMHRNHMRQQYPLIQKHKQKLSI